MTDDKPFPGVTIGACPSCGQPFVAAVTLRYGSGDTADVTCARCGTFAITAKAPLPPDPGRWLAWDRRGSWTQERPVRFRAQSQADAERRAAGHFGTQQVAVVRDLSVKSDAVDDLPDEEQPSPARWFDRCLAVRRSWRCVQLRGHDGPHRHPSAGEWTEDLDDGCEAPQPSGTDPFSYMGTAADALREAEGMAPERWHYDHEPGSETVTATRAEESAQRPTADTMTLQEGIGYVNRSAPSAPDTSILGADEARVPSPGDTPKLPASIFNHESGGGRRRPWWARLLRRARRTDGVGHDQLAPSSCCTTTVLGWRAPTACASCGRSGVRP